MEEPQLLLHCQRGARERTLSSCTLSVWAPAKPCRLLPLPAWWISCFLPLSPPSMLS